MPNAHPVLTHFPIVLLTLSFCCDALSMALQRRELERIGGWSELLGAIGLAASIITGLIARSTASIQEAALDVVQTHEQVAFIVAVLFSVLVLWRLGSRLRLPSKHRWPYLILSLVALVFLWVGAWFGGELVFHFGIGVQGIGR